MRLHKQRISTNYLIIKVALLRPVLLLVALFNVEAVYSESKTKNVSFPLNEGSWMSLDVSPDGQWLVFDLLNDIYLMSINGGKAKAIHSGSETQRSPQFSPDGQSIAFLSDENGTDNIWTSNIDGSDKRRISNVDRKILTAPAWRPDAKAIAAVITIPEANKLYTSSIKEFYLDGSQPQTLVEPPEGQRKDIQEPRYSSDGDHLYYTQRIGGTHFVYMNTGLKNFAIMRKDLSLSSVKAQGEADEQNKTKAGTQFISGFGGATTAQISPDSTKIAFVRRHKAKTVLFIKDTKTLIETPIYDDLSRDLQGDYLPQEHYYPAFEWLPDNRHIVIWSKGKIRKVDTHNGKAEVIPFEVQSNHQLQPALRYKLDLAPETVSVKAIRNPVWIEQKQSVIFRALSKLWVKDLTTQEPPIELNQGQNSEFEPTVSNDGNYLAYVSWLDEKGSSLTQRNLQTGVETELVSSTAVIREPVYSTNGQWLAYRVMAPESAMNAPGPKPGVYVFNTATNESTFVVEALQLLGMTPDAKRVLIMASPTGSEAKASLQSVDIAQQQFSEHGIIQQYDIADISISPDAKWLAFKEYNRLYVAPFDLAQLSQVISHKVLDDARLVAPLGGYDFSWANSGDELRWTFGPQVCSVKQPFEAAAICEIDLGFDLQADTPTSQIAFVGGKVIPIDGKVIEDGVVLVEGNRIAAVGTKRDVSIPKEAQKIDISGKVIMPGLVDAHGHIDCCYAADVMPQKHPTRYAALAYGITTNFDPYSNDQISYEAGEMTMLGRLLGPRWFSSAQVVHGVEDRWGGVYHQIQSLEDARDILKRRQALGISVLKSYKMPTRQERQWLVQAAGEYGYMVDGEGAGQFFTNINMILDGHTNLEHNLPVDTYYQDIQSLLSASEVSTTPTLIVVFGELFGENYIYQNFDFKEEQKIRDFVPDVNNSYNPITGDGGAPLHVRSMHSIKVDDAIYDIGFRSVARTYAELDRLGVAVNVGSHGQVPGLAMHWEMMLLSEGGMSNDRILRAATLSGAKSFGLDHQLGTITPGKLADLIVLDKDPLVDIRHTNSVSMTMIDGRLYDARTMNQIAPNQQARGKFYWELINTNGIDWNPSWGGK